MGQADIAAGNIAPRHVNICRVVNPAFFQTSQQIIETVKTLFIETARSLAVENQMVVVMDTHSIEAECSKRIRNFLGLFLRRKLGAVNQIRTIETYRYSRTFLEIELSIFAYHLSVFPGRSIKPGGKIKRTARFN